MKDFLIFAAKLSAAWAVSYGILMVVIWDYDAAKMVPLIAVSGVLFLGLPCWRHGARWMVYRGARILWISEVITCLRDSGEP